MYPLKQSVALTIPIFVHDASGDSVTGLVDAGFTKRISKNGGAFAAMTVTITEMENGFYSVPISASHADTLGVLTILFTHASAKQVNLQFRVHARLPDDLATASALTTAQNDLDIITGATGALLDTTASSAQLVDDVWDEVLTGATHNIASSAGRRLRSLQDFGLYEGGAVWIDTVNGTAGTVNFENGTVTNPVLTLADARTLATSLGLTTFQIINGSTVTLASNSDNLSFRGENWTLALGGQSIAFASFEGAIDVSGVSSGNDSRFQRCHIKTSTIGNVWASDCRLAETITLISTGGHFFQSCYATTGTIPIIDLGAVGAQTLCLTPITGGVQINNTAAGDLVHIEGAGEILLDPSCNGGTLEYAGDFRFTNNATSITVNADDNTENVAAIKVDTDDIQTRVPAALVGGKMDSDVGAMQADVVTASALATDAVNEIRDGLLPTQNVAFPNLEFLFVSSGDHVTPATGATGTAVTRSIDGSAFGAGTGTLAEVGNGIYQYDASAADMNGGIITFRFTGTGGTPAAPDDTFVTIVTGGGV